MDTATIHVGFGHMVSTAQLIAVLPLGAAPTKRLIQLGKDEQRIVDFTDGRRPKAVLLMDDGSIILASVTPDTIIGRVSSLP